MMANRVKAETEGRIKQERQNHDLRLAQVWAPESRWSITAPEVLASGGGKRDDAFKPDLNPRFRDRYAVGEVRGPGVP